MPIILPKQSLLMSLYFGENLPNWPSIVHFYLRKLYICRILSGNHQEGEQVIFMDIRALLYANNRTKINFSDKPLFWRKSAQFVRLLYISILRKFEVCTILPENHHVGEQIIFMDVRVLLNANNRINTDFSDESLFLGKSAQFAVYCTFLFKEIGICTILSGNPQEKEHIIFMDIRVN